jgi:hypothetical protein
MTDSDLCINAKPSTSEEPDLARIRNIVIAYYPVVCIERSFLAGATSVDHPPGHNGPPLTNRSHETISCVAQTVAGEGFNFAAK